MKIPAECFDTACNRTNSIPNSRWLYNSRNYHSQRGIPGGVLVICIGAAAPGSSYNKWPQAQLAISHTHERQFVIYKSLIPINSQSHLLCAPRPNRVYWCTRTTLGRLTHSSRRERDKNRNTLAIPLSLCEKSPSCGSNWI